MFESHFFSPSSAERDRGWGGCALTIGTVTRVTGRVGGAAAGLGISHANGLPMMRSLAWLALLATSRLLAAEPAATPQLPYTLPATMEHHRFFVDATSPNGQVLRLFRSEEHTSELQSLMRISYAVFCLKKKKKTQPPHK